MAHQNKFGDDDGSEFQKYLIGEWRKEKRRHVRDHLDSSSIGKLRAGRFRPRTIPVAWWAAITLLGKVEKGGTHLVSEVVAGMDLLGSGSGDVRPELALSPDAVSPDVESRMNSGRKDDVMPGAGAHPRGEVGSRPIRGRALITAYPLPAIESEVLARVEFDSSGFIGRRGEEVVVQAINAGMIDGIEGVARDVSSENRGWDIDVETAEGNLVVVEVKTTKHETIAGVELTEQEWQAARKWRHRYWLVIVRSCLTQQASLLAVHDPATLVDTEVLSVRPSRVSIDGLNSLL